MFRILRSKFLLNASSPILSSFTIVSIALAGLAQGDVIGSHAGVRLYSTGSGTYPSGNMNWFDVIHEGMTSDSLGPLSGSGDGNYLQTATAYASVAMLPSLKMHVFATSTNTGGGWLVPAGIACADANWRDIVFLTGPDLPDKIRLHFNIEGSLSEFNSQNWMTSYSQFLVNGEPYVDEFYQQRGLVDHIPTGRPDWAGIGIYSSSSGTNFVCEGFSQVISAAPNSFSAEYILDVPYSQAYSGYTWQLGIEAYTQTFFGDATCDFGNTVSLTSVSSIDNSPLQGYTVRFDSGLQIVPEPSTLVLLGIGAIGLIGYAWRRRK
jgi:hypothetical protein